MPRVYEALSRAQSALSGPPAGPGHEDPAPLGTVHNSFPTEGVAGSDATEGTRLQEPQISGNDVASSVRAQGPPSAFLPPSSGRSFKDLVRDMARDERDLRLSEQLKRSR